MDKVNYKVYISCATYNHAPYIEDALKGFCIQQTDFPYIAVVIDDNSSDGTWGRINDFFVRNCDFEDKLIAWEAEDEHAIIRFAQHNTNKNLYFKIIGLKYNHHSIGKEKAIYYQNITNQSKYCAVCEGDDYWIDPFKLKKQVAILDTDSQCMMVRTNINRYFQDTGVMEQSFFSLPISGKIKDTYSDYVLRSWFNGTCTWCYRAEMIDKIKGVRQKLDKSCFRGDALYSLMFCRCGSIKYLDEVTTVYRVLKKSASHHTNKQQAYDFWHSITRTRTYFANDFNVGFRLKFWSRVCWELFYQMAARKDVSYFLKWISFCFKEFGLLFVDSKRLRIKI